jgi:hypothetical protein
MRIRVLRPATCGADRDIDIVSLVNQPPWSKSLKPLTIGVWSYRGPNCSVQGVSARGADVSHNALI